MRPHLHALRLIYYMAYIYEKKNIRVLFLNDMKNDTSEFDREDKFKKLSYETEKKERREKRKEKEREMCCSVRLEEKRGERAKR